MRGMAFFSSHTSFVRTYVNVGVDLVLGCRAIADVGDAHPGPARETSHEDLIERQEKV